MKKLLKKIVWPIWYFFCRQFYRSTFRYSGYFSIFRDIFEYSDREQMIKRAMRFSCFNRVQGDYLEFGVWKGGTICIRVLFCEAL